MPLKIGFAASRAPVAQTARAALVGRYGNVPLRRAPILSSRWGGTVSCCKPCTTPKNCLAPVYGMNRGTIGFLMNEYNESASGRTPGPPQKKQKCTRCRCAPLALTARSHDALAINEVSLLRASAQAAKLRITVDGRLRMEELVCDGALVATPAGSTAYNYSAHGPVLPIGSDVLALTAVAPFRPRRWRGALLPKTATVRFDVLEPEKRPVMAEADSRSVMNVTSVVIRSEPSVVHRILFDPGHGSRRTPDFRAIQLAGSRYFNAMSVACSVPIIGGIRVMTWPFSSSR